MSATLIASAHARAEVRATAALVRRVHLRLPDGRWIEPLADAPWAGDPTVASGHLRWLGGEFFCLPFGGAAVEPAPPGWSSMPADPLLHGPSADADWTVVATRADYVDLRLDYPPDHDILRVERRVACSPVAAALDITVTIHARRRARVPAASHPILRLPLRPGALRLAANFAVATTHPAGLGTLRPQSAFGHLNLAPGRDGPLDFSRLPLGTPVEEVVQLLDVNGPVTATYVDEDYALTLDWDRDALPHALVWLHDRAIHSPPWNGAFRGLGIEPCASAFDLPAAISASDNPLALSGWRTALVLDPAIPKRLHLRIEASGR